MTLHASLPAVRKGRRTILHPLELTAEPGQMLGVIGPNGAGKSTLLRSLAGAEGPRPPTTWQGAPLPARRIAYMPQAFQISAGLTVLECVLLGRRETLGWHVLPADMAEAEAVLHRLGLSDLAPRGMDTLSGGQQQMVLLAQRLVRAPLLMVLDEPTSALDLHHQLAILRHLVGYARSARAVIVLALHDLTLAARFCDRLWLLHQGALVDSGPAARVLTARAIGQCWQVAPEILTGRDGHPVIVPH
ncbi:ABC transporter ATP-binding protein [Rhodobacter sp. Har01]|uniref:ABC transporter ATP-binding protein n=1 Tax=Rhodobacter sp. Har01 TaxID=2883999 RepID=UPI001D065F20|nr:ABC transporter ATP-binding protein [Rhodobacter sp. Har01]MCB6178983.1 ABC transporter ATP-binding protein [Rhodobacter sp. Har01]